jgi:hypothetical protein
VWQPWHGILAAAVAAAGGNDALTAGLAAGGAEAVSPVIAQWLYGTKDPDKLNADQKNVIASIAGLIGAGVGATTGNVGNAVENNVLFPEKILHYSEQSKKLTLEEQKEQDKASAEEHEKLKQAIIECVLNKKCDAPVLQDEEVQERLAAALDRLCAEAHDCLKKVDDRDDMFDQLGKKIHNARSDAEQKALTFVLHDVLGELQSQLPGAVAAYRSASQQLNDQEAQLCSPPFDCDAVMGSWHLRVQTAGLRDDVYAQGQAIADMTRTIAELEVILGEEQKRYQSGAAESVSPESWLIGGGGALLMRQGIKTAGKGGLALASFGAVTNAGVNYGVQYWTNPESIDWLSVGLAAATGFYGAPAKSILPVLELNVGSALLYSGVRNQNPAASVLGTTAGTVVGWGAGSVVGAASRGIGNTVTAGTRGNYSGNWFNYGTTVTSYKSRWHQAAPVFGLWISNFGTEVISAFGSELIQEKLEPAPASGNKK